MVSPLPPPNGGIACWTASLLEYYRNNDGRFELVHQNTSVRSRRVTNTNIFTRFISGIKETRSIYSTFKFNLDYIKPDVVHITTSASLALLKDILLIRLAARRGVPAIMHFHFGRIPDIHNARTWEWSLLCKLISSSRQAIVIDMKSYSSLIQFKGYKNISYIPNPISAKIESIAYKLNLDTIRKKKGKVVFVGHIIPTKGVFELLEASMLVTEIKELVIIGPYERSIKKQLTAIATQRDNGSWVRFTGNVENEEVLNYLKDSAVLILPSYTEGFPIVVLEAMAMGCAVIASEVGAIPEILNIGGDKPCGICIKPRNTNELRHALSYLMSDYEKIYSFGNNGIARVLTNYTMSIIGKEYEKAWHMAVYNGYDIKPTSRV